MAKGNLFLGQARGSVGDVTFYRMDGAQVSRARNRKPSNPNSYGQLVQRAVSATVARAYAVGKAIFDHSFQGKRVPSGCANRFRKVNMELLRSAIVADLADPNATGSECTGCVVARGSQFAVPWRYRISEGELIQNLFLFRTATSDEPKAITAEASSASETVMAYLQRLGITDDDIFTLVGFGLDDSTWASGSVDFTKNYQSVFGFVRLEVKTSALTLATLMSAATWADIFTISASHGRFVGSDDVSEGINLAEVIGVDGAPNGAIGCIRSRENQGLRSTSDMFCGSRLHWGITSDNLLDAWDVAAKSAVDSELILEGGNF